MLKLYDFIPKRTLVRHYDTFGYLNVNLYINGPFNEYFEFLKFVKISNDSYLYIYDSPIFVLYKPYTIYINMEEMFDKISYYTDIIKRCSVYETVIDFPMKFMSSYNVKDIIRHINKHKYSMKMLCFYSEFVLFMTVTVIIL